VLKSRNHVGFYTGLCSIDYSDYPAFPYRGRNWQIELLQSDHEKNSSSMARDNKIFPARELAIYARDHESAQRAADLIHSSRLLLDGSNVMSHLESGEHLQIWRMDEPAKDTFGPDLPVRIQQITTVHLPFACMVAAKASFRLAHLYALAKLRVSYELASVPLKYLDPSQSDNIPKSPFPEDHVRMAHALIAAWSCVEELGFEVRASAQRPSKLPNGAWNPIVRVNLEERLRKGGVDLSESFPWNLRGPRTRIERKRPPEVFTKAEWSRWNVRDGEMEVINAINYVSFLRSSVAAHKVQKQMIRVLSIYDVVNAQFLARRLLLEKLGFWRYQSQ
jgi:hypothetical protein